MSKVFIKYNPEQAMLLPPDIREWLPEGHLAEFVSDVVDVMDLKPIMEWYEKGDGRGRPPYHPVMMVKLLFYGYSIGEISSRKIEKATYEDVGFRVLACNTHPDHDSIADFRKRHLRELARLFFQVLRMCDRAGLVKLGQVAIDGSKIRANASKRKAMSYDRMISKEKQLEAEIKEIEELLRKGIERDEAEDREHGKGKRGDELPDELARRESRLVKIKEAKAALEKEAKEKAEEEKRAVEAKIEERRRIEEERGKKVKRKLPAIPDVEQAKPDPKAQKNFTDPESRIMKDGATGSFEQSYNGQIAVDAECQIIVAMCLTQEGNDKKQLVPMLNRVEENMGRMPDQGLADAGLFSVEAVTDKTISGVDLYVTPDRGRKTEKEIAEQEKEPDKLSRSARAKAKRVIFQMRKKLRTEAGREIYSRRKVIVEPVFGQIKEARGFRRFSFRGLEKTEAEWTLVGLTHNLLKLFRSGFRPQLA